MLAGHLQQVRPAPLRAGGQRLSAGRFRAVPAVRGQRRGDLFCWVPFGYVLLLHRRTFRARPGPAVAAGTLRQRKSTGSCSARGQADQPPVCLAVPARLPYGQETEALLSRLAQSLAVAAESLRTYAEERHIALTLQRSFLPQRAPRLPGADIALRYIPGFQPRRDRRRLLHRRSPRPPALLVGGRRRRGALPGRGHRDGRTPPCPARRTPPTTTNRAALGQAPGPGCSSSTTPRRPRPCAWPSSTRPRARPALANAGHLPPLLLPSRGEASFIETRGPLLGLGLRHPPSTRLQLGPHDGLLMLTDGLIERRGTDLADSLEHLQAHRGRGPAQTEALCDTLLDRFGNDLEDDVALLALRLNADRGPSPAG